MYVNHMVSFNVVCQMALIWYSERIFPDAYALIVICLSVATVDLFSVGEILHGFLVYA